MPADLSYERVYPSGWRDRPNTTTPINQAALNHLEDGIVAATERASVSVSQADISLSTDSTGRMTLVIS